MDDERGHPFLPTHVAAWARRHRDLLELIASHFATSARWPSRPQLQRQMAASMTDPPALAPILSEMPKPLGFTQPPGERVVLTLFGLYETSAGGLVVEQFIACLRLAVDRYRATDTRAELSSEDVRDELGLAESDAAAISEVLLRESPYLGSGYGAAGAEWKREVSEDIVRYWNVATPEDYLRVRAKELAPVPQLGWAPLQAGPTETASDPEKGLNDRAPRDLPPWLSVFVWATLTLSSLVPLVLGSPIWITGGVLGAAAAAAWVWRHGFRWPPSPRALGCVAVSAVAVGAVFGLAAEGGSGGGTRERTHVVCIDTSYSAAGAGAGAGASYYPGLLELGAIVDDEESQAFVAGCGANPAGTVRWDRIDAYAGNRALAQARWKADINQLLYALAPSRRGAGTPLGEILSVMASKCAEERPRCHLWFFTDALWKDELIDVYRGISLEEINRYVAKYVQRLAAGLSKSKVSFVGAGLGTDLDADRLEDAKRLATTLAAAAGASVEWRTDVTR